MICPICGSKVSNHAAFCDACGAPLNQAESGVQTVHTAAQSAAAPVSAAPQGAQTPGAESAPQAAAQQPFAAAGASFAQPSEQTGCATPGAMYGAPQTGDPYGAPTDAQQPGAAYSGYYAQQFSQIASGYKGSFNPAAFFLGPYHALYRGMTRRFCTAYLPLLSISLLSSVLCAALLPVRTQSAASSVLALLPVLAWLCSMASVGVSIWNGITFNRAFYHKQQGNPNVPAHTGRAVALGCGMMGISLMSVVLAAAFGFQSLTSVQTAPAEPYSSSYSEGTAGLPGAGVSLYPSNPAQAGEYYGPVVGAILQQYASYTYDQKFTRGYAVGDAWQTEEYAAMLDGFYLFANDSVTLSQLFTEGTETYTWYEETDTDTDYDLYTMMGVIDDTTIQLTFGTYGGTAWLESAMTYLSSDDADDSFYSLNADEACALLQAMYDVNSYGGGFALAQEVRGTWQTEDGSQLVLDAESWNGQAYTLWYLDSDTLALWLTDTTDASGEYYLELNGDELTVYQEAASDSNSEITLEEINRYSRTA